MAHQKSFDEELSDLFTDEELGHFERSLEEMASLVPQEIFPELSYDDFEEAPSGNEERRDFFERCQSCLCLENMPFLETNRFQVSYLKELIKRLGPALVDQEQFGTLLWREEFEEELHRHRSIDDLVPPVTEVYRPKESSAPVDPIDFLIRDVYREFERLHSQGKLVQALTGLQEESEKLKKLFFLLREEKLEGSLLYQRSGLNPKDFDDTLEKLKFYLRRFS